jgi:hypothetical protein
VLHPCNRVIPTCGLRQIVGVACELSASPAQGTSVSETPQTDQSVSSRQRPATAGFSRGGHCSWLNNARSRKRGRPFAGRPWPPGLRNEPFPHLDGRDLVSRRLIQRAPMFRPKTLRPTASPPRPAAPSLECRRHQEEARPSPRSARDRCGATPAADGSAGRSAGGGCEQQTRPAWC